MVGLVSLNKQSNPPPSPSHLRNPYIVLFLQIIVVGYVEPLVVGYVEQRVANVALSQFVGRRGLECRSGVCRPKVLILTSLSGTWGHLSQSIEVWQGLSVFSSLECFCKDDRS